MLADVIMIRTDWTREEVTSLFQLPFNDLLFQAQQVHREHFDPNQVQLSTLLSIKTGKCSEDCGYCSQSARYDTALEDEPLYDSDAVLRKAKQAKAAGATRFCMGAAWRAPKDRDMPALEEMVSAVRELGMETCLTAGMLTADQAGRLKHAGLDYYNHNLDTSRDYYPEVISTRSYDDRLDTLSHVRAAGINVCCGGILGMGEQESDRIGLLHELATLPEHPQSVPINQLVPIPGTPLEDAEPLHELDFVRTIAVARILMPRATVRLSAGRHQMSDALQTLCFHAGANSIFYGDELLTTDNAGVMHDKALFGRLGLHAAP